MSGTPADKTYAKRQRPQFETPAGERAFKLAAREVVGGSGSRGKLPLGEEKGAVCLEEEDLDVLHMLRIMGVQKGRPSPLSLRMICC
jgi:hypothetical protein